MGEDDASFWKPPLAPRIMRRRLSLAVHTPFVFLATLFPLGVSAQNPPARADYTGVVAQLEPLIRREMRVEGLPIVGISLVDDQSVVWAHGFGSDSDRPVGTETIFRVGSVSKL